MSVYNPERKSGSGSVDPLPDRDAGGVSMVAEAVKRAGSIVAGLGAAAIDLVRNEKLPKALRDDYTALNLAAIGYAMLFTTARALDDARVADLAERHLRDHADVLPAVGRSLEDVWRNGAPREFEEVGGSRR